MKYQIADQINGPFGDIYDNLADAEKELESLFSEHLAGEMEGLEIMLETTEWMSPADDDYKHLESLRAGDSLEEVARRRMAEFTEIVEVED
ncbi:MAG: hypothetical protein GX665_12385 [Gammaproteobacteria bacterium]|nr:hypothetical protein [Gammaproteobacteria bacterium]